MLNSLSKVLVVATMLITFVGQAWATTAMPCEISTESHQSHMQMDHSSMNHHEGMNHVEMNKNDSLNFEDCCGTDCLCPTNACTTVTVLISDIASADLSRLSEAVTLQQSKHTKSIFSSLFRPPIFA